MTNYACRAHAASLMSRHKSLPRGPFRRRRTNWHRYSVASSVTKPLPWRITMPGLTTNQVTALHSRNKQNFNRIKPGEATFFKQGGRSC